MENHNLPNRKYMLKKTPYAAALNTAIILAMLILTVMAIVAFLEDNLFIPALHLPLLTVITAMAIVAYYLKIPPPYVKILDGKIKVRKRVLGGWETAELKNLSRAAVKGSYLSLVFGTGEDRELRVNLEVMNYADARELREFIKVTVGSGLEE